MQRTIRRLIGMLPVLTFGLLAGTAQATVISGNMTSPTGTQVDMYRIFISNPASFSASAEGVNPALDLMLFLFYETAGITGNGIAANEDAVAFSEQRALLPVGNSLYASLASGFYWLHVSTYSNYPYSVTQSIFDDISSPPWGDGVDGANPNAGSFDHYYQLYPTSTGWNGLVEGPYNLTLTAAEVVPEPGTLLLIGSGLVGLAASRRRRR